MRVITNRSTGEMGRLLATAFAAEGAKVTLLEGLVTTALPLPAGVTVRKFFFFDELKTLLKEELGCSYDAVVHAAAVSDFKLKKRHHGKIVSGQTLTLSLVPTEKLLNSIKRRLPNGVLIGFKFEPGLQLASIHKMAGVLFDEACCDIVVANKNDPSGYAGFLIFPDGRVSARVHSKQEIAGLLINEIYHACS